MCTLINVVQMYNAFVRSDNIIASHMENTMIFRCIYLIGTSIYQYNVTCNIQCTYIVYPGLYCELLQVNSGIKLVWNTQWYIYNFITNYQFILVCLCGVNRLFILSCKILTSVAGCRSEFTLFMIVSCVIYNEHNLLCSVWTNLASLKQIILII